MSFLDRVNQVQKAVGDLLFPRRCPFCDAIVEKDLLCRRCRGALPFTEGRALQKGTFGHCASPLWYEGDVRKAILRYKFNGRMGGLNCFGSLMAQCAAEELSGEFDAITWVPISRKRLRQRGFDQSRLLAASVCVDWHTEPVETLKKVVDNPPQSGTEDAAARRANVLGVYEPADPAAIAGKRWLLVDDVITTGSTLAECARVLKEAGAADVVCLTLAAARRG